VRFANSEKTYESLAQRMIGEKSLAEDAVQDAFVSAFRGLANFKGQSSLKTWLHRITVNASLMMLRINSPY